MKIKTFFLFPDTDDDFIRLGENHQVYADLIKEIAIIKHQLKTHGDFELCYDSQNIAVFLSKAETLVGGIYLSKYRSQLQLLFGNNTRNVSTTTMRKNDCYYVHWKINSVYENAKAIIAEATEAKQNEGTDKTVVVNIAETYVNNREEIHVVKDALHINDLPILVSIPTVNNEIEFSQWITTLSTPHFSLTNKEEFQITAFKWRKQKKYRQASTNNYWYYDYFHDTNKKHFEVFNAHGIHLGEASIDGILDATKADNQKRIDYLIQ